MLAENVTTTINTIINNNDNQCGKCIDKLVSMDPSSTTDCNSNKILFEPVDNTINTKHVTQIFRFKFTPDFMDELFEFSKIHQYDERKDFKEAWIQWVEDNKDMIADEINRLNELGYDGDILDKMFKSARYYFRKKGVEKKEPRVRRAYISVSKELLDAMDAHIEENIDYQPKNGFVSFCKDNEALVKEAITNMIEKGIHESSEIQEKIKKTYKNRYFRFVKN